MTKHDPTETYPRWLPDAKTRDDLFKGHNFHQGKLLAHLRQLKTPANPQGLGHPDLLRARLEAVGSPASVERWIELGKTPVLDDAVELDEWVDIARVLGWEVFDVLRWLCVSSQFGRGLTIGECVKDARTAAGVTQRQLADKIGEGFTHQMIHRLEKIKYRTTLGTLRLVAEALGVHVMKLIPANQRALLTQILSAKQEVQNGHNLFERRKKARAENPDISWNALTPDLLETLGY